jgi:S1-C subfamily serine protease
VIDSDGYVLTAQHVIAECSSVSVGGPDQKVRAASVLAADETSDLAILKVSTKYPSLVRFRHGPEVRQGEDVVVVGYPLAGLLANGTNISNGIVSALAGLGNDRRMFQISAPVQEGNSGGPLLDRAGNVVGIVEAEIDAVKVASMTGDIPQNVNFALKAPFAWTFAVLNAAPYHTADSSVVLPMTELADRARRFTVLIICWQ